MMIEINISKQLPDLPVTTVFSVIGLIGFCFEIINGSLVGRPSKIEEFFILRKSPIFSHDIKKAPIFYVFLLNP